MISKCSRANASNRQIINPYLSKNFNALWNLVG
jgi:hypothetical protein